MKRHRQEGFTLLEMLVILGILGLIAGIGFPALDKALKGAAFHAAAARVELALRQRQAGAVRLGRPQALTAAELRAIADGPDPRARSATLRVEAPQGGLLFFPDGTSRGGEVVLMDGRRQLRFAVDADRPLLSRL